MVLSHDRIWVFFEFHDECRVSCGGVSGTGLPLVVTVLVCSMCEWFVVVPTADSPLDSGDIAGVDADAFGFSVAADLSSLKWLRFLRSDFPDEVCTMYDLGQHISVQQLLGTIYLNPDHILEHVPLLVCLGGLRCAGHVETLGMTAFDTGRLLFFLFGLHFWGTLLVSFPQVFSWTEIRQVMELHGRCYLPTPPPGQDMTQGQFLSRV